MRAWTCNSWGGPETLTLGTLSDPSCPHDGVAIQVTAWGVNFADLILIAGHYQARPAFPFAPGMEVAGIVNEVGPNVTSVQVGDRVAAYVEYGGYAECVIAPATNVVRLPPSISFTTGAAFPVPYATAALAIDRAGLNDGELVLIGGAGGAVGSACVELAKLQSATVIACVGDEAKKAVALGCGADHIVSSRSASLKDEIKAHAPGGVDVAFDPIGGDFFTTASRSLAYGGRLVTLGFASGDIPTAAVNHILVRHTSVIGSSLGLTCHKSPETVAKLWPVLAKHLEAGNICPRVTQILPFEELPRALQLLADRKAGGRIVIAT